MELSSEIVTIFSLIVSSVLVGVVVLQYRLSSKQYETVNRPWLVLRKEGTIYDNHVRWYLENIGNLPAKEIIITSKPEFEKNGNTTIPETTEEPIKIGIIMPKQKYDFAFNYFSVDDIMGSTDIKIDVSIQYKFLNRKKISKFEYIRENMIDYEEVTCIKAD